MKLNKILTWGMVALILASVGILVWGFVSGFETPAGDASSALETLLYWTYCMIGLAVVAWVVVGGIVSAINDPKFLVKVGILLVAIAAICFVAYMLAPGSVIEGRETLASASELKLTDTILNLIYFVGAASLVAIVVGEVRLAIVNRK